MAVGIQQKPLTYEEYLAEGETEGRYEIIDGIRIFMTSPSRKHQRIIIHLTVALMAFERSNEAVRVFIAPSDLLISGPLLKVRQPDMYVISLDRLGVDIDETSPAPLGTPPQLAIEILSPSDSRFTIESKLLDYAQFGIDEVWLVSNEAGTVQVMSLTEGIYQSAKIYGFGDTLTSVVFNDLAVDVEQIFAP